MSDGVVEYYRDGRQAQQREVDILSLARQLAEWKKIKNTTLTRQPFKLSKNTQVCECVQKD